MGVGRGGGGVVLRYGVRPAIGVDGALAVLWIDGSATIGLRRGERGKSVRRWWEGGGRVPLLRGCRGGWVDGGVLVLRMLEDSMVSLVWVICMLGG